MSDAKPGDPRIDRKFHNDCNNLSIYINTMTDWLKHKNMLNLDGKAINRLLEVKRDLSLLVINVDFTHDTWRRIRDQQGELKSQPVKQRNALAPRRKFKS